MMQWFLITLSTLFNYLVRSDSMRRYQYTQLWHELKELAFISKNIQAMAALKIIHQKKGQKKKKLSLNDSYAEPETTPLI